MQPSGAALSSAGVDGEVGVLKVVPAGGAADDLSGEAAVQRVGADFEPGVRHPFPPLGDDVTLHPRGLGQLGLLQAEILVGGGERGAVAAPVTVNDRPLRELADGAGVIIDDALVHLALDGGEYRHNFMLSNAGTFQFGKSAQHPWIVPDAW